MSGIDGDNTEHARVIDRWLTARSAVERSEVATPRPTRIVLVLLIDRCDRLPEQRELLEPDDPVR